MAGLSKDPSSGNYRIQFWYGIDPETKKQRHFTKSLRTKSKKEAEALAGKIEMTLLDLERGRLQLPPGADFWQFVLSDGKREQKLELPKVWDLQDLFKWYFEAQTEGAKESNTLATERTHSKHLQRLLGASSVLTTITRNDVQEMYVNHRAKERRGKKLTSPDTIQKEIMTLQMAWNRAWKLGQVPCQAPTDELVYPKKKDKPPFQTWEEIEGTIGRGGVSDAEVQELWDALFLTLGQIAEVIEFVRTKPSSQSFFYPLIVFAAHTGARRSEMIRSRVEDFKFADDQVRIREKKKQQTAETTRWVPMSPHLKKVMKEYFDTAHPGGIYSLCVTPGVRLTEQNVAKTFTRFFEESKWAVLKGYHVFRHSFASNMALKRVDERVIDELMGHQTEAMRKRYRHLFPEARRDATAKLYG